jgi:hypothetical protein
MLSLIALGLLMGARDVLDIWRKVACLSQSQREAIGLRVRDKQTKRLKMPGYDALNELLAAVDPEAYAQALTAWLQANSGLLPRSLALDGKSVGDGRCGMIITLCRHEDGRPVAMAPATGKKEDCEVSEARALLADDRVQLANALITADPLHNKHDTIQIILQKGGDYLVGTKENGRIDRRQGAVAPISPVDAQLPGARSAVTVCWEWSAKKQPHITAVP